MAAIAFTGDESQLNVAEATTSACKRRVIRLLTYSLPSLMAWAATSFQPIGLGADSGPAPLLCRIFGGCLAWDWVLPSQIGGGGG